jgi:hypothetical protein
MSALDQQDPNGILTKSERLANGAAAAAARWGGLGTATLQHCDAASQAHARGSRI